METGNKQQDKLHWTQLEYEYTQTIKKSRNMSPSTGTEFCEKQ